MEENEGEKERGREGRREVRRKVGGGSGGMKEEWMTFNCRNHPTLSEQV